MTERDSQCRMTLYSNFVWLHFTLISILSPCLYHFSTSFLPTIRFIWLHQLLISSFYIHSPNATSTRLIVLHLLIPSFFTQFTHRTPYSPQKIRLRSLHSASGSAIPPAHTSMGYTISEQNAPHLKTVSHPVISSELRQLVSHSDLSPLSPNIQTLVTSSNCISLSDSPTFIHFSFLTHTHPSLFL